ncbi:hypothetical protein GGX14DRAFT_635703 [Mycena pura]|uniref:CBM21 domain-containing protein n=1 Tax=Mycena pura TaxID=153505 RepID=A0AAD6VCU6_9AGAR|nr:hypothetical protein GGX14DRAFT_635703 [Mycena pura]
MRSRNIPNQAWSTNVSKTLSKTLIFNNHHHSLFLLIPPRAGGCPAHRPPPSQVRPRPAPPLLPPPPRRPLTSSIASCNRLDTDTHSDRLTMPYSDPGVVAPPPPTSAHPHPHSRGRPGHRRSYTLAQDAPGPGAFAPLAGLPRRHSHHAPAPVRAPRFHFRADEDDGSSSSSDEPQMLLPAYSPSVPAHGPAADDDDGHPPPLRLRQPAAFRLTPPVPRRGAPAQPSPPRSPPRSPNPSFVAVSSPLSHLAVPPHSAPPDSIPFPRAGASSPVALTPPMPKRPTLPARASSQPLIFLANGKPLKSSLKSSRSAPNVPSHHLRARSAPLTPVLSPSAPSTPESEDDSHDPAAFASALAAAASAGTDSPTTPKAVHFPSPDEGLETVLLFKRSARPASVSFPLDDETETETETDSGPRRWAGAVAIGGKGKDAYPFPPRAISSPLNPKSSNTKADDGAEWLYALHAPDVPGSMEAASMVLLERVWLEGAGQSKSSPTNTHTGAPAPADGELHLCGTLLVRNATFEKHVFVRFTLDEWCTTSEVSARYVASLPGPPSAFSPVEEPQPGPGWDRFEFAVRLTDYAHSHLRASSSAFDAVVARDGGQKLRPLGVAGLGRGLAGRELVMVARFFSPWVAPGGVAPYVWCDALVPATGESKEPRRWTGTGAGGAGEWWDNNGGRNYRVGFKVERVVPPAAQPQIPFPTIDSPVQADSSSSASAVGASPPPPPPRTAQAQALAVKLGRLNLRNYSAPNRGAAAVPGRALSLPATPSPPSTLGLEPQPEKKTDEGAEKEKTEKESPEAQKESQTPKDKDKDKEANTGGVGLYWPWGRSTMAALAPATVTTGMNTPPSLNTTPSPASPAPAKEDDESSSDDFENETPPTSPLGAAGLLGLPEVQGVDAGKEIEPAMLPLPASPPLAAPSPTTIPLPASPLGVSPVSTPPASSSPSGHAHGSSSPLGNVPTGAETSSSLYKAFLRQWCFAGAGPGAGAGARAGASPGPQKPKVEV